MLVTTEDTPTREQVEGQKGNPGFLGKIIHPPLCVCLNC